MKDQSNNKISLRPSNKRSYSFFKLYHLWPFIAETSKCLRRIKDTV